MIPSSVARVPRATASEVNEAIRRKTEQNVVYYAAAGHEAVEERLVELDHEWDIERALQANFGVVVVLTALLALLGSNAWILLTLLSGGFQLQHVIQGWCPPLPLWRRLGYRTRSEIEVERHALKALRGDYEDVPSLEQAAGSIGEARRVLEAVTWGGDLAMEEDG